MEELLKCFPADLAAEMMGVADHEGQNLSPSLQKLMLKFSAVQDGMTEQEAWPQRRHQALRCRLWTPCRYFPSARIMKSI